jgi:hypothetical protein
MIKKVIALALIFLAGGAWLYMDCLNRQEIGSAAQLQQGIMQARAEAKKRADSKANNEKNALATLNNCQAAADKAKVDYLSLIEQTAPRKKGVAVIPPGVTEAVEKTLAGAKADCQLVYDNSLKTGS